MTVQGFIFLQEAYWRHHAAAKAGVEVEYGNDVEGTAFAPRDLACPLGSSAWNLAVRAPSHPSALCAEQRHGCLSREAWGGGGKALGCQQRTGAQAPSGKSPDGR